jgi:hypothetical protein
MGPYVTMVFAIFLIVFTSMTIQSQVNPVPDGSETENQQNASSSGNFAATIAACKNTSESTAKIHQFYPITGMIWHGGSTEDEVMIDDDNLTDYIQRRENVPIPQIEFLGGAKFRHLQQIKDQVTLDGKKYEVYFPVKSGEFQGMEGLYKSKTRCEDPNDDSKCKEQHQIYFVDYELVFLRHLDDSGFPIIVPGTATEGKEYNLADIYQSVKSVSDPEVGKLPDEAFDCSSLGETPSQSSSSQPNPTPQAPQLRVVVPEQQNSGDNNQLQLQWFAFSQSTGDEPLIPQPIPQLAFEIGCKPAVYLYPPTKQLVNVKVSPKGFLTYTDPLYDLKTGWTVEAYPDGKIYDSRYVTYDKSFNYLYYESKIRDEFVYKPTKGWVIQSSAFSPQSSEWFGPMEDKFNQLLPQLGLNTLQTKDFIDYWKKALPYSPYYFIGIMDQDNIDQFEPLTITPKPDSVNRVRIYFERLDQPKIVEAPDIVDQRTSELGNQTLDPDSPIHQSTNSLFRVVEWGGMIKNDPNHPFTCSQ